jgi:hypothetical protein
MGNCGSQGREESKDIKLVQEYEKRGLPKVDGTMVQNEFEKQCFMTINIIRTDPPYMSKHLKSLQSKQNVLFSRKPKA